MKFGVVCSACLLLQSLFAQDDLSKPREWTGAEGKKVKAQLMSSRGERVTFKLASGNLTSLDKDKLSIADIKQLNAWEGTNPSGYSIPYGPYKWPPLFRGKDGFNVKYSRFDEARQAHVYETEYFNFFVDEKLSHSTLWDCFSIFFNVAGVLDAVPLHLDCIPKKEDKKYEVILVSSDAMYRRLGGPPNSGGFYDPRRHLTVIPFKSLGLVKEGKAWKFDKKKRSYRTLIHELTHHLTYRKWKGQPCWLEEGLADFMGAMPYKGTEFSFAKPGRYIQEGFIKMFKGTRVEGKLIPRGVYQAISLEYMFKVDRRNWNGLLEKDGFNGMRQYHTSLMMVYYFAFLDGKGDGANLVKFMHAQRKHFLEKKITSAYDPSLREKYLLRGRSIDQLETQMVKAFAENKLQVKFRR